MENKNILIATQTLGIGGCETYILTQCKVLVECGYNIIILAKDGVLRHDFEKLGVKFYDIDLFRRDEEVIENVKNIIQNEKIDQVHIHPFYPLYSVVVASILAKTPYILYFHGVIDIEAMFESVLGKGISKLYLKDIVFKYASRFIYVSEEVKRFYENTFKLDENKGFLLKNSIYLEKLEKNKNTPNRIKKIIVVSRLDEDKVSSVKQAIDFYIKYSLEYSKRHNDSEELKLDICGDGNATDKLKEYVNSSGSNYNINFIGSSNTEVFNIINNYDVVMGMGRCILEAISIKKIPILVSYNEYVGLIDANNIVMNELAYSNFSGRGLKKGDINSDINNLLNLDLDEINTIVNKNYDYIEKNNNIGNLIDEIKCMISDVKKVNLFVDVNPYIEIITNNVLQENDTRRIIDLYDDLKNDFSILYEQHDKDIKEIATLKEDVFKLNEENRILKEQLEYIKSKKIYKIYQSIDSVFKNKGGKK